MKKTVFFSFFLFLLLAWAMAADEDKPLKGLWDFKPECQWSMSDFNGLSWGKPLSVLILGNGNVAVFDPKLNQCILLDSTGQFLTTFAPKGEGPQEIRNQSFWYSVDGQVIIPTTGMIHFYDEQGKWLESRKVPPMPPPRGFIDKDHMVMVPRTVFETGGEQGYFSVIDLANNLKRHDLFEVSNLFSGGFAKLGEDVMDILVPGLSPMIEVGIGKNFMVYGSSREYQLTLTDSQGKQLGQLRLERKRTPIPHARIAEHLKLMNLPADKILPLAKSFPEHLVFFEDIHIEEHLIWIQQANLGTRHDSLVYDVFSRSGEYLYRAEFRLPSGHLLKSPYKNHFIRDHRLVAVVETADSSLCVASYRLQLPR